MRSLIISRPDRVGDVIISTSCLVPIKEKYPDTKIYFVADERMRPLLENHPLLAGFVPLFGELKSEFERVDASDMVHLHPNEDCYLAAQRADVPLRIGYGVPSRDGKLTHAIQDRRAEGQRHEGEYNFDLLGPLGITPPAQLALAVGINAVCGDSPVGSFQDRTMASGSIFTDCGNDQGGVWFAPGFRRRGCQRLHPIFCR
jgi:ADP-heptose:LPS heptosyltransferase